MIRKIDLFVGRYSSVIQSCSEGLPLKKTPRMPLNKQNKPRMASIWGKWYPNRHDPIPFESEVRFALTVVEVRLFSSRPKDDLCSQYLTI